MIRATSEACRVISDGLALEARYTPGTAGAAVVAPPHPLAGGSLDNPVVSATLNALADLSLATLAFNYRGVERSEGRATESLEAAVSDYTAALAELAARRIDARGPCVAAGYSYGAGTALLAARDDARIAGVVLIAPPLRMLHADDLMAFKGRVLVVLGDDDDFAPVPQLAELLETRDEHTLEVIAGTDHFFHFGGLAQLARHVTAHVRTWL